MHIISHLKHLDSTGSLMYKEVDNVFRLQLVDMYKDDDQKWKKSVKRIQLQQQCTKTETNTKIHQIIGIFIKCQKCFLFYFSFYGIINFKKSFLIISHQHNLTSYRLKQQKDTKQHHQIKFKLK